LLGPFGSEASRVRYGELIAKFASGTLIDPLAARSNRRAVADEPGPSIAELIVAFLEHAKTHYIKDGKPTSEQELIRSAVRPLRELYALLPAKEFGPIALKAVRSRLVESGVCRNTVNLHVSRIRHVFRHAVANEMIPVEVLTRLESVEPLLAGRTKAPDHAPRTAVPQEKIDAVKAEVGPLVRDLIDLQLLTGARSGELLVLTTRMIDRTGEVWNAKIVDHKTVHHGHARTLHFGPKAQLILAKYLSARPDKPLFEIKRLSYGRAVIRGCERAFGMPMELRRIDKRRSDADKKKLRQQAAEWRAEHCWSPHWLRHTAATRIREQLGIENVQSLLGHSAVEMSRHYSANMNKLAASTAAACG
jgi:integrase